MCPPSSDCRTLISPFFANGNVFQVHCNTDFPGYDLMQSYATRFETCLKACASYNNNPYRHEGSNCTGVAYNLTVVNGDASTGIAGNCFLKGNASRVPSEPGGSVVDSAFVITG